MKVGDTPMMYQAAAEHHEKVAYAHLKSDLIDFSTIDWQHSTRTRTVGNPIAIYLDGGSYRELRQAFYKLSVELAGALLHGLNELDLGIYGHLAGKYGVHWFFQGERCDRTGKQVAEATG